MMLNSAKKQAVRKPCALLKTAVFVRNADVTVHLSKRKTSDSTCANCVSPDYLVIKR